MHRRRFGCLIACVVLFCTSSFAQDEDETKLFTKRNVSLSYPSSGWMLEDLPPPPENASINIRLTSKQVNGFSVVLTFRDDCSPPADDSQQPSSAELGTSFGLGLALKLAEKHEDRIVTSYGLINFAEQSDLAARFLISKPDSDKLVSIESFVHLPEDAPNNCVMGAVVSPVSKKIDFYKQDYFDVLYEAYGIVQSIVVKPNAKKFKMGALAE